MVKFALYYRPKVILIHNVIVTPTISLQHFSLIYHPRVTVNSGASWDAACTGKNFPTLPESLLPPFSVFNP